MNLAETNDLLTFVAVYDNRRFDDATVMAWYPIFKDLPLNDCQAAVIKHFGTSDAYLMPFHIRQGATEIDRERRRQIREERERQAQLAIEADPTRRDRSEEVRALIARLRLELPEGDPDKLRYGSGHWRQVREARERQEAAVPNPDYDPTALKRLEEMNPDG